MLSYSIIDFRNKFGEYYGFHFKVAKNITMHYVDFFMRILIIIGCAYAFVLQIFRILWLYFPDLLKGNNIYKRKSLSKFELLLYFIAMLLILLYYGIYLNVLKFL